MHSTSEIEAIVTKARRQRADFIGTRIHGGVLPLALVAVLSFALVQLAIGTGDEQALPDPAAGVSTQNG